MEQLYTSNDIVFAVFIGLAIGFVIGVAVTLLNSNHSGQTIQENSHRAGRYSDETVGMAHATAVDIQAPRLELALLQEKKITQTTTIEETNTYLIRQARNKAAVVTIAEVKEPKARITFASVEIENPLRSPKTARAIFKPDEEAKDSDFDNFRPKRKW